MRDPRHPFLRALSGLTRLKHIDISAGATGKRAFSLSTDRIIKLLDYSWKELDELIVYHLKPSFYDLTRSIRESPSFFPASDYCISHGIDDEEEEWEMDSEDEDEDEEGSDGEGEEVVKIKSTHGLKVFKLVDPDVCSVEIAALLKNVSPSVSLSCSASAPSLTPLRPQSVATLKQFILIRPSLSLTRFGLSATLLTFGKNLTSLEIDAPASWHSIARPSGKVPTLARPKDYVVGHPRSETLAAIATHPYFIDAILPYLPKLETLRFYGPLASHSAFSVFPVSLKT